MRGVDRAVRTGMRSCAWDRCTCLSLDRMRRSSGTPSCDQAISLARQCTRCLPTDAAGMSRFATKHSKTGPPMCQTTRLDKIRKRAYRHRCITSFLAFLHFTFSCLKPDRDMFINNLRGALASPSTASTFSNAHRHPPCHATTKHEPDSIPRRNHKSCASLLYGSLLRPRCPA
jgi:hypothetical protein